MAIKNYTTDVPVTKTVGDIHVALAAHGARRVTVSLCLPTSR